VGGLEDTVGVNILVASSGHTESIPRFSLGRVDVLVTKVELTELILSMELAGGNRWDSYRGSGSRQGQRSRSRDQGGNRSCRSNSRKRSCNTLDGSRSRMDNLDRSRDKRSRSTRDEGSRSHRQHRGRDRNRSDCRSRNRDRKSVDSNRGSMNSNWSNRGSMDSNWSSMNSNWGSMGNGGGKRNFIISINGLCFSLSLLPLRYISRLSSSMGSKVFSLGSSNLRGVHDRFKSSDYRDSWDFRGNR